MALSAFLSYHTHPQLFQAQNASKNNIILHKTSKQSIYDHLRTCGPRIYALQCYLLFKCPWTLNKLKPLGNFRHFTGFHIGLFLGSFSDWCNVFRPLVCSSALVQIFRQFWTIYFDVFWGLLPTFSPDFEQDRRIRPFPAGKCQRIQRIQLIRH